MIPFLIALLDRSLNVTSYIEVIHDFDGELSNGIINHGSDRFDVAFMPFFGSFFVNIVFNGTAISTEPIELISQRN